MTREVLIEQIYRKKTFLCIGLDTDPNLIPDFLKDAEDPVFEFNKLIVDHTKDLCVSYKLNTAFYEAQGVQGWTSLKKTIDYIPSDLFTIADAKRGDIGNTSRMYAKAFFEAMNFDSITVAPYMGSDSVSPFLNFQGKWVILLALTSNPGSQDFQCIESNHIHLYEEVVRASTKWAGPDKLMYVVGATQPERLGEIRKMATKNFFLVPGIGAQGGSLKSVVSNGFVKEECCLLVNSSRGIIYAGDDQFFAEKSRQKALGLQKQMSHFLS